MDKEQEFYKILRKLFIGASVEGDSGFIHLMQIKSCFYERRLLPQLQHEVQAVLQKFPDFREELFQKLYDFFHCYFSESGSVYFRHTPLPQGVYEKVRMDDRDVLLFWKTHMLYYVKTERQYRSLTVNVEGFKFHFDVSHLHPGKASEKKPLRFQLQESNLDDAVVFQVLFSERGQKTRLREILKRLKARGLEIGEDILQRAFLIFEQQNEVDFFINKDARTFLKNQLELWFYHQVYEGHDEWSGERIQRWKALKRVALTLIDLISHFEDELVRIWKKPRFALNAHYVITLNKITERNPRLLERIIRHRGFKAQMEEWQELGLVTPDFEPVALLKDNTTGRYLNLQYLKLPIDTRYFKELEPDILNLFDDLDQALDGWLVKSENFQALNTILPKFKSKVQTIFIDPPFNKEQDAGYHYSVKFKDANWITLLENRLVLARQLLKDSGAIFVRCDYNGNMYLRLLMNEVFGAGNFRNEFSVRRIKKNVADKEIKKLPEGMDTIFSYAKSGEFSYHSPLRKMPKRRKGFWRHMDDSEGQGSAKVFFGRKLEPPTGRHWKFSQKNIDAMIARRKLILICKDCGYRHGVGQGLWKGCPTCGKDMPQPRYWVEAKEEEFIDSNWTDIYGYANRWKFRTENSEFLLERVISISSHRGDLVMDYFLGSGTTVAVAQKLGRNWIGVEMGEHFYTVLLPRMKRVLAGESSGISKKVQWTGGGFFKYYELEQYQDILKRVKYGDIEGRKNESADVTDWYHFLSGKDQWGLFPPDTRTKNIGTAIQSLYEGIDLAETLSLLLGKWICQITKEAVLFEDGDRIAFDEIDYKMIAPLVEW